MAKKIQKTNENTKVVVLPVASSGIIFNDVVIESSKKDKLDILIEKLDRVVELLENPVNVKQTKLSEMSLSDLNYLKEMLSRNITMNNYPGGDIDIKVKSNDLIIKITSHINNKISLYE